MLVRKFILAALTIAPSLILPAAASASDKEPIKLGVGFALTRTSETGFGGAATFSQVFKTIELGKISWVVDVGANKFSDFSTIIPAAGIRVTMKPHGTWTFFGQMQLGTIIEHDFGGTIHEWGIAPGIGAVLERPGSFNILIQADLGLVHGHFVAGPRFLIGMEKELGKK